MVVIDPVAAGARVPTADRATLRSVRGSALADVGQVPRLAAQATVNELRRHAGGEVPDAGIFGAAARLFTSAELDGETVEQYVQRVSLGTGLTAATVRRSMADLTAEIDDLDRTTRAELPTADLADGHAVHWSAAGTVFAAVMASNHPVPHVAWVQALYHGYAVLVRPGSRDPFTPRRLCAALLRAGLGPEKVAFLPCGHGVGEFLLEQADRGIIYGDEQAVRKWRHSASVAVRGPGRTKALVDVPPTEPVLDHLATSAAFDGGTRCTNLSAVLTTQPVRELGDRLAARLGAIPARAATDPSATLPVVGPERAEALRKRIVGLRAELTDHTSSVCGDGGVVELPDGSFALRPLVLSADRADHPAVGAELPFPFVVLAPWSESDGLDPLRHALVLNLWSERVEIERAALREPTIRKVTRGAVPAWTVVPGLPHEGNYTQFLLQPKGVLTAV